MSALPVNLRISPTTEEFYTLLAGADVQIGVGSTGLFEGMALGARTIVLNLFGAERMEAVLASGEAVLAHSGEEIAALLNGAPAARDTSKYYAPPVPSVSEVFEQSRS